MITATLKKNPYISLWEALSSNNEQSLDFACDCNTYNKISLDVSAVFRERRRVC
ncbi:hypothetical protein SAMN04487934_11026 [Eubacterium ruminantium]|nr:hypothetical protein SAMN04487934_11026 [Eubacterium ruminantium]